MPVDDGVIRHRAAGDRGVLQVIRLAGVHAVGPPGHVDRGVGQRLVHRDEGVPEAADALLVAQRLPERLAQRDGGVLDGVVALDLDVALGPHGQVEAGVAAQRRQHVVVERHTGVDVNLSGAVEVELDDDVGFLGTPFNSRAACCGAFFGHGAPTVVAGASSVAAIPALARRKASFSSARPVVARR